VNNKIKRTVEERIILVITMIISIFVFFITAYPIYYSIIFALSEGRAAMGTQIYLWPISPTFENFRVVFEDHAIFRSFGMSTLRTSVGVFTGVLFTAMVAYALTREELRFRRAYAIIAIITMYFSGGVIPTFLVYRELMITNTFWVLILPGMLNVFHMLLFMAFFRELPDAIFESAKIDGASEMRMLLAIALPLSKPILATVGLFVGVHHWNDWFMPTFFTAGETFHTLPVMLMRMITTAEAQHRLAEVMAQMGVARAGQQGLTVESIRHATMVVSIIPIMMVYPFIQRHFEKGIMLGSIKA